MIAVVQRPFPPLAEKTHRLRSAILISLFVFSFLYIFKPFGLAGVKGNLILVTAAYGLITLTILLITQFLFPVLFQKHYDDQKWTVGKEILQTMSNVLLIAIGNFLLSCYLNFFSWSIDTFVLFVGFTFAIGIIPVTIQALVRQNIHHRRNAKAGSDDNRVIADRKAPSDSRFLIKISREDDEADFQAKAEDILAVESCGNYIEIHRKEGKPILIRKSLISTERNLPIDFFRTHRSWIVNLPLVSHVDGNARGYILSFKNASIKVPVSRSKLNDFDAKLKSLSKG